MGVITIKYKLTLVLFLAACMAAAAARTNPGDTAVFDICANTYFKETCHKSLAGAAGTQPKDLIKAALDAARPDISLVGPAALLKPTVTVAQDNSGQFTTIDGALKSLPQKGDAPVVVFVKAGVYKENVIIPKGMNNVALIGEGPLKTKISGDRSNATGFPTDQTATLAVEGDGFFAKDIKIENTAPSTQAVAVRTNGDRAVFYNVHFEGLQDTLYAQTFRQFYRDCRISGTVDFIFGDAVAVFQNCDLVVRKPLPQQKCTITDQGRMQANGNGVTVIQGCRITAEQALLDAKPPVQSYLGRPWKEYSRVIIMQSDIGGFISPEGWLSLQNSTFGFGTLYYGEFGNTGAGSDLSKRVGWEKPKGLTAEMAQSFTAEKVFVNDDWVKNSGVPYVGGMLP